MGQPDAPGWVDVHCDDAAADVCELDGVAPGPAERVHHGVGGAAAAGRVPRDPLRRHGCGCGCGC